MPKKIKLNGPVIGDGGAWLYDWLEIPYISASKVSKELEDAGGEAVELYINSGGGSVFAGSEVYTILKEYAGDITAKVTGVAASAASFLMMAAKKILVTPTGQIMIHNATTSTDGDKHYHASNADLLSGTDVAITNAYRLRTGKTKDELLQLMNKTTWMNAQKAIELGFADEIMFDEENSLVEITNSISSEIPSAVIDKLRDVLVNSMLKGDVGGGEKAKLGSIAGIDLSGAVFSLPVNASAGGEPEKMNQEGELKAMNEDELKAKHPDLYNTILEKGVTNGVEQERARITALNELADAPGAEEIVAEAIANGTNAAEAALKIVAASKQRIKDVAASRKEDGQKSNAGAVPPDEAPIDGKSKDQVYDEEATALGDMIKNMAGGKR